MSDERPRAASPRKIPKRVTPSYLENAALHYLERFASSTGNLRRVLMRKVAASAQEHGTDAAEAAGWVEALIERYVRSGILNDDTYARMRAETLHRRGTSSRAIREKLAIKGIKRDDTDRVLTELAEDHEANLDLTAALALARRRRLGPYRLPEQRAAHRDKDLASLGRAGFSYAIARQVIDAEDPDSVTS